MSTTRTELSNLLGLAGNRPKTKTGLIRWSWHVIDAARRYGFTLKELRDALARDGVDIRYSQFRYIVAKVAKEKASEPWTQPAAPVTAENGTQTSSPEVAALDGTNPVVAGMIEQETKRKALEFRHERSPREEDLF